jgi:hypothetical protein
MTDRLSRGLPPIQRQTRNCCCELTALFGQSGNIGGKRSKQACLAEVLRYLCCSMRILDGHDAEPTRDQQTVQANSREIGGLGNNRGGSLYQPKIDQAYNIVRNETPVLSVHSHSIRQEVTT